VSIPERSDSVGGDTTSWDGEPVPVLRGLWQVPFLEVFRTIGSTNDRARELKLYGRPDGSLVIADEQTSGRGREGRKWYSAVDGGIWMSWIAPPLPDRSTGSTLPLLVGLAVAEAIEAECPGVDIGVKWPNDLLIDGKKCAGILCERAGDRVVVGIGINVRPFDADVAGSLPDATSLEDAGGMRVSRTLLVGRILSRLDRWVTAESPDRSELAARELRRRDVLLGREVTVGGGGQIVEGVARGIDADGALELQRPDGSIRRVWAGSVRIDRRKLADQQDLPGDDGNEAGER